ncbi:PLD nuclease N-terminal domain-containing protein [Paucisalibacillus sp. EB02]|uniref:PLD nuclease N-terminal domain-containing protein n=1 Tax=Paucisalibacillus sp. EB02 TaxID=1347087 RepID=UPI0004BA93E5|nr:PLD nuclease N-terminal domain-containing protein [Paucisalibacillus sp. EB02]
MEIDWALIAPILIINVILLLVAIVDLIKVKETNGPKWLWAIIIFLVSILGPVLYFILGRRSR